MIANLQTKLQANVHVCAEHIAQRLDGKVLETASVIFSQRDGQKFPSSIASVLVGIKQQQE
jgi:hypothetical protein